MHLGGRGILSPQLCALLPVERHPVPSLFFLDDQPHEPGFELSECTTTALFHFYDELQDISVQASALNRHHRPRGTLADETGVQRISANIADHLNILWLARPRLLCLTPRHNANFTGTSDSACDLLVALCRICYFAETVYIDRAHSKDHSTRSDAQQSMQQMRQAFEEFSTSTTNQHLDAALIWPLFLHAAESRTRADVNWALSKLRSIQNPLWQSEIVTTVVQELTEQQLSRGERVGRWFINTTVPLPLRQAEMPYVETFRPPP
ncbi:hypothetical protein EDD37DRAFT_603270 [Exophiala viscosa]|uniref:Uncharacterized protein n=1 Tax=Exophiala viscosa TaxID=2486360 RepID=A0AAN6I826_9EURO|nr:hypothetical protein EDD36DRAFT_118211 [Exophiala viscosa]KAI1628331.1 hypothetical protein EDD37DRAFT_603270 [Exophiala viscosa]